VSKITVTKRGVGKTKKYKFQIKYLRPNNLKPFYATIEADGVMEARGIGESLQAQDKNGSNKLAEIKSDTIAADYIERFIKTDLASDGASPNTIKRYAGTVKSFFGTFLPAKHPEITKMSEISRHTFGNYKDYLLSIGRTKGWSAEIRILKPVFSKLVRREHCPPDVEKDLKEFKTPKPTRKEGTILNKTEKKKLLDAIKRLRSDYYGITYFIMRNAWRIDEVCNIKKANIKTIGIRPVEVLSERKDRKIKYDFHFKSFDTDLENHVRQYLYDDRKTYLFANRNNKKHSYRHYEEYLARISQEVIGKRLTPTDLRKTCITELVNSGISANDLMAITGHRDYSTVIAFYSSSTADGVKKGLEATRI
jgi:site-specific recombinase XerD